MPAAGGHLRRCPYVPAGPPPQALGRQAARVVAAHPEQGWSLLCNGVVVFDGTGVLLPGGWTQPGPALADAAGIIWPVPGSRHAARLDGWRVRKRVITHRHGRREGLSGDAR
jgi:hypothetical protein